MSFSHVYCFVWSSSHKFKLVDDQMHFILPISLIWIKSRLDQVWRKTQVPADPPSRGGEVAVYIFDINQPNLPTPFFFKFCSCTYFCLNGPFDRISFINSSDNSSLSHSVLPVLFLHYWSSQLHIYLSPHESFPQPWYNPLWLTGLNSTSLVSK